MTKSKSDFFGRALATGAGLRRQEQQVTAVLAKAQESRLPINEIRPRHNPATRALDPTHVLGLAESISALGLIEPLAVDMERRLVAGGHRWAALRLIATSKERREALWRELFDKDATQPIQKRLNELQSKLDPVAIHILPINSAKDPGAALAVEVAENERRRNYTKDEVHALAATLKAAGYRDCVGRPKTGERAIIPALSAVLGRSRRTIFAMLSDASTETEPSENSLGLKHSSPAVEDKRLHVALSRWLDNRDSEPKARVMAEALIRHLGKPSNSDLTAD